MKKDDLLNLIRGKMIVSCQAVKGEPLYVKDGSLMCLMARAAKMAGAPMIRTSGIPDVTAVKKETKLPVIGLVKIHYEGFDSYITPTMKEVDDLVEAGADIVAADCTFRRRGDGSSVNDFLALIRAKYPDIILMADISTYEEGVNAACSGADIIGTTMSGYTDYSPKNIDPDYELMERLSTDLDVPVIGEGRIHYPYQAVKALQTGVWSIVVGGAITRPLEIAQRFMKAIDEAAYPVK